MLNGLYILDAGSFNAIYALKDRERIAALVNIPSTAVTPAAVRQDPAVLANVDVIFSGWGGPKIDDVFLAAAPNLKMVFYGAGTIRGTVTEAFWDRGVRITSAYAMNAIPVAEYTLAMIILGLKQGWQFAMDIRRE